MTEVLAPRCENDLRASAGGARGPLGRDGIDGDRLC